MTQKRGQLLELLAQFRSSPDAVESAYRAYMAELLGLMRYLGVAGAGQGGAEKRKKGETGRRNDKEEHCSSGGKGEGDVTGGRQQRRPQRTCTAKH